MYYFPLGAPKTADIQWLENDMQGNDGGFVFQIEILGCQVGKKNPCCDNMSPLIMCTEAHFLDDIIINLSLLCTI